MIAVDDLITELDELLVSEAFEDYGPNGLQVPTTRAVDTVATGVSASAELFERAARAGAQLVLVHHGLFWPAAKGIDRALHRRLAPLFAHDIGLAAYHLPLDAHPVLGNNALLARGLGCEATAPFGAHKGRHIGVAGRFADEGVAKDRLLARVRDVTGREPLHLDFGPPVVRSIGIVSGGAPDHLGEAIASGLDAFLTGEPAERVMTQAREAGVHFLAAGHYATETFGIRALGEHVAATFGVDHVFLDDPNPI